MSENNNENNNFKYLGTDYTTSLNVNISQPLDTRTVVLNKEDLINNVAEFAYYGMIVYVENDQKHYYLVNGNGKDMLDDASNIENWKEVGVDEDKIQTIIDTSIDTVSSNLDTVSSNVDTVSSNLNTLSSNLNGISNTEISLIGHPYNVHISELRGIEISSDSTNPSKHVYITNSEVKASDITTSNLSVINGTLRIPIYNKSGNTTNKYASLQIIETENGNLTIKIKKLDN